MSSPNPGLAVLFTWLVPGGGHFYLGKTRTAVIGFAVIQGLYLLGVILSGGMFMEILPGEMKGPFAAALTPEAGNLGALIAHIKIYGYGGLQPRTFPSGIHLGVMLTAAAGVLNLILASRAHFDARAEGVELHGAGTPHPAKAALFAWLVPGGGHFLQGRTKRGVVVFVVLVLLFALGSLLADGSNLDRTRHFYYWGGQVFLGPVAFIGEFIGGHGRMTELPVYADAGVVIASIAGMLNVLVMLDVYGVSEAKLFGHPLPTRRQLDADDAPEMQDGGADDADSSNTEVATS